MKIVNQNAILLKHDKPPNEFIEQVARVCYKSEKHIEPGSADKMVKGLVSNSHLAMLEHEYIYIEIDEATWNAIEMLESTDNKYLNIDTFFVSGSIRAWKEWADNVSEYILMDDSMYSKELCHIINLLHSYDEVIFPYHYSDSTGEDNSANLLTRSQMENACDIYHIPCCLLPHTIKFTTSRAIANELVRHRVASFAQESQRYVDYKKSGEIEIITPTIAPQSPAYNDWHYAMIMAETQYFNLRKQGIPPQIARGVLPNDAKTEIVVTSTEEEWQHIINLRYHGTTGAPHPQMKQLMELAYPILQHESGGRIK